MPTIAERLETATTQLEAQVAPLSAAVTTCTTKASEASTSATAAAGSASTATTKAADAETARAAAVTAKNAAETAETNAETAEANAETAETNAAASATAAAGSATTAGTHATNAGNSATAAAASATAAAGSATTASGHKDTATTKATEAAASAAAALTSQNAAAASAATAAGIAGFTAFKGTQAGASVPATSTNSGDAYLITSAGTSQSKTWAVNDLAIYNGTSGSWTQVSAAVWMGLTVPALTIKQPRDVIYFDALTAGQRVYHALGTAGNIGTREFARRIRFMCPSSIPAGQKGLWFLASVSSNYNVPNSISVELRNDGTVMITLQGATTSDYNRATIASFISTYGGQWVELVFVRNAIGNPTIAVNGVVVTPTFTTGGTPPSWQGSITSTFSVTGTVSTGEIFTGLMELGELIFGPLTAAEILLMATTGRLPLGCEINAGSAVAKYTSNFSAGADSWATSSGGCTGAGNVDSINGQDDWFSIQRASTTGLIQLSRSMITPLTGVIAKRGARLTMTARVYNASATNRYFGFGFDGHSNNAGGNVIPTLVPAGGQADIVFSRTLIDTEGTNVSDFRIISLTSTGAQDSTIPTGDLFYFKNINLYVDGAVYRPVVQPIPVVADAGANKLPGVCVNGATPITDKRDWVVQGKTSTNGNEQLLGASVFTDSTRHMLDTLETNGSSTATVSIGSASGGAQYKASAAIASGRNRHALVTPIPASNNIWVASNTTDVLQHTIRGHLVD